MNELEKSKRPYHIIGLLAEIDAKSIRALREGNQEKLEELEAEAELLRAELREIKP